MNDSCRHPVRWLVAAMALALIVAACSSSNKVCTPGQQVACACVGGAQGAQVCKDDGSGFLECACSTGDAGTPDAKSPEAGSSDAGDASSDVSTSDASDAGCSYNANPQDNRDHDNDGYSVAAGDCNDCNPSLYPGNGC